MAAKPLSPGSPEQGFVTRTTGTIQCRKRRTAGAAHMDKVIAMSGTVTVGNPKRRLSRLLATAGVLSFIGYCPTAVAQTQSPPPARNAATLFENVRIFDGR